MGSIAGIGTVALLVLMLAEMPVAAQTVVWTPASQLTIEGIGYRDTPSPYDRLPSRAQSAVSESVWALSHHTAGVSVRFQTRARRVWVCWSLTSPDLAMPHMPATGVSGVDLYAQRGGRWVFVQNGRPVGPAGNQMAADVPQTDGIARCCVYLPLYNGVKSVDIGVEQGMAVAPLARPLPTARPTVVYGTSIVQGGCASRPGMAWPTVLSRILDAPVVNLGFSGSGQMEPVVADLVSEIDARVFVIDCLWNMGGLTDLEIKARIAGLISAVRKRHPAAPIVFVGQSLMDPAAHPTRLSKLQIDAVKLATDQGVRGLVLVDAKGLIGDDGDGTVDGCHPTDIGMVRQAGVLAKTLKGLLR